MTTIGNVTALSWIIRGAEVVEFLPQGGCKQKVGEADSRDHGEIYSYNPQGLRGVSNIDFHYHTYPLLILQRSASHWHYTIKNRPLLAISHILVSNATLTLSAPTPLHPRLACMKASESSHPYINATLILNYIHTYTLALCWYTLSCCYSTEISGQEPYLLLLTRIVVIHMSRIYFKFLR